MTLPFRHCVLPVAIACVACSSSGSPSNGDPSDGGPGSSGDDSGFSGISPGDDGGANGSDGAAGAKGKHDAGKGPPGVDSGGSGKQSDGGSITPTPTSAASWFPATMYFNVAVDTAPIDANSATIISTLVSNGGWGGSNGLQIDTSIDVYYADSSSKSLPFTVADNLIEPDSDVPTSVPVDPSAAASSTAPGFEDNTSCADDDDCHYLVMDVPNHQLIEIYGATTDGTTFTTLTDYRSVAIWDWTKPYLGSLRGDVCTSADASGALLAPVLFTAEEVAAGHIDHAIRFILPNTRIQNDQYVRPATHGTGDGSSKWAESNGVPYGARLRLHSTFDTSSLSAGAKVVAAALMKYGMILSDGGNIAFTAKSDAFSTTKWAGLLGNLDLNSIQPTDFDMVDGSYGTDGESSATLHNFDSQTDNCVRNP
jgi:hypothetical protein